jgi:hypothetical protein
VSPKGFEPLTYGFEARRSIQLSYGPLLGGGIDNGPRPGVSSGSRADALRPRNNYSF